MYWVDSCEINEMRGIFRISEIAGQKTLDCATSAWFFDTQLFFKRLETLKNEEILICRMCQIPSFLPNSIYRQSSGGLKNCDWWVTSAPKKVPKGLNRQPEHLRNRGVRIATPPGLVPRSVFLDIFTSSCPLKMSRVPFESWGYALSCHDLGWWLFPTIRLSIRDAR